MSEYRIDYLKKQFDDILENICSAELKCFHIVFKPSKMTEIIRRIKTKKRRAKYTDKKLGDLRDLFFSKNWSSGFEDFI
eukprot:CAMPEP_0205799812 /NCGR_PEP_ID=MMETSP0205-20121125/1230_1 /ASSEMBLY_ACC=CAM_ASM_000278 /TAXON_ID=36767 /ORGANISM="Euplotes focardii, Strain TN1" /LENGTH=78 /DNA_ID=CAMNT_0053061793 /DNA_START=66 /DNA_END=302 /DNA_ORIENTATION=+